MNLVYKTFSLTPKRMRALTFAAFILAALVTGGACVLFMKFFEWALQHRVDFTNAGPWCWLLVPALFLISVEWIRRMAPLAGGTGIPQTIYAVEHMNAKTKSLLLPLLSLRTMLVKVIALVIVVMAGASTGREGPSVQIASCVFLAVMFLFRRLTGIPFDLHSAVVAGGAAGLAAAFNTPLAGVAFAIEELTPNFFSSIKDFVLIAIIIAALTAQSLTGEYAYFGKLTNPERLSVSAMLLIGIVCGTCGAFFSTAILRGQKFLARFHVHPVFRYVIPAGFALGILALAFFFGEHISGPGNQMAKNFLQNKFDSTQIAFPFAKLAATLFTYWSGAAGGIFAPCLTIGAALGAHVGHWLGISVASCALVGMSAFLASTIQAPITSFVIIFEMTGNHEMLLPIMLCSLLAVMVAKILGADHLYKSLAENYKLQT